MQEEGMAAKAANLVGPQGQLYADPIPTSDETSFKYDNTSAAYYASPYYTLHKDQVQAIPRARNTNPLVLEDFLPQSIMDAIDQAGKIVFHTVGDTGAAKVKTQSVATAIAHEGRVADAMTKDLAAGDTGPA